jgi:hypothetical protein
MRHLACPACGQTIYFETFSCVACGAEVAFSPQTMSMRPLFGEGAAIACANRVEDVCNWATAQGAPLCPSCRLNRVIPNLSFSGNRERWRRIEQAKRRVIVDLMRLTLPIFSRHEDSERGLAFEFVSNALSPTPIKTGHDNGVVTLDIAEADDPEREARRHAMGEPYRTLVGHFRHEIAHYYWTLLVENAPDLQACRAIFGDERDNYNSALQRHYANGPPADWSAHFISAYASSHPWEDWAETFAHFVHIVATMDTALGYSIAADKDAARIRDPYLEPDFDALIEAFVTTTGAVNEINRSMGLPDVYPFVLTPDVIGKLHFVHMVVRKAMAGAKEGVECATA